MNKVRTIKIFSMFMSILFFVNTIAFALGVPVASNGLGEEMRPGTKDAMYAGGQKLLGYKRAHEKGIKRLREAITARRDLSLQRKFVGTAPEIANIKFARPSLLSDDLDKYAPMEGNKIYEYTDLIEALKYYRDNEAQIKSKYLDIKEGYFEVDERAGEYSLARIERNKKGSATPFTLVIHTKLVQMWDHIRKHDVRFDYTFEDGTKRRISTAWGIFFRLAKHEMTDVQQKDGLNKFGGHLYYAYLNREKVDNYEPASEETANNIGGRYRLVNNGIWLWFLESYCFMDRVRYNDDAFKERLFWFFAGHRSDKMRLEREFPMSEGYKHRGKRPQNIARAINYHFFSRRGIKVPKLTVDEDYVMDYQERKDRIRDIFPITGIDDKKDASDTSDPKQHPFIKVISQWVINIGTRGDAQMSDLTLQETQNIYDTVTLLDARQTEVILPQSFDVTNITREAIQDINKRAGENTIKYTPYSSAEHLKTILIRELPEGMRRIVITETGSSEDINTLLKKSTALFQGERLLNIELPPNYEKMDDENKTVHQARIFMVAILARLLEKDKTPWVETLLKDMLREHLNISETALNTYIKKLGETEDITDLEKVKNNIQYFLGNVVHLVEILEKEFRLMERFWTSA